MIAAYYTHHNTDIVLAVIVVVLAVLFVRAMLRESGSTYYCINGHIGWEPFDDQPEVVCGDEFCPYGSYPYDPDGEGIHHVWQQSDGRQVFYHFDGRVRTWK